MSGFSNDLAGGNGNIVLNSFQSPDFVHNVSGWQVTKTGDAEFNNGTFRGVVTASTFEGTDFIINSSGAFFYSGTPAANNLIHSIAAGEGKDANGNWYLSGDTSYGPDSFSGSGYIACNVFNGYFITWFKATVMTGSTPPWQANASIWWDESGLNLQNPAGNVEIEAIGGTVSLVTLPQWQTITLDAGWSTNASYAVPSYQLLPDGNLQLTGLADFGSTTTSNQNLNNANPLPPAYRPVSQKVFRSYDGNTLRGGIQISTSGVITMLASASFGARYAELDAVLPLNL